MKAQKIHRNLPLNKENPLLLSKIKDHQVQVNKSKANNKRLQHNNLKLKDQIQQAKYQLIRILLIISNLKKVIIKDHLQARTPEIKKAPLTNHLKVIVFSQSKAQQNN